MVGGYVGGDVHCEGAFAHAGAAGYDDQCGDVEAFRFYMFEAFQHRRRE